MQNRGFKTFRMTWVEEGSGMRFLGSFLLKENRMLEVSQADELQ